MTPFRFALTALLVFVFSAPGVYAQDRADVFIGFKGGVSIPQLSGGEDNEISRDYKSRLAPNFGAFFDIPVSERFSVQPEVNFAGQGGTRNGMQPVTQDIPGLPPLPPGNFYYADFDNEAVLNYLEIPVLAKYKFGPTGKPRFYVNGGVFYGRLVSAETKTRGTSTLFLDRDGTIPVLLPPNGDPFPAIPFDADTDVKGDINSNNFGFTGGGGFEIPFGANYLMFDARVSRGIVDIQRDPINGRSQTGNVVISLGWAFGID
ncbi:MAG: PorT family protein [Acidobacteria bacterium]|nr:MAG: PorT family protein [Acidobacteriota bacterium]REK02182.1 MAG: PorT family protein [Acidobacteriota bacterium]REK14016.1 MAG: PorT family protein [Acidobacteriota bacterium]REK42011.1 MAG: PorT family protein [Acidobacteriota bacterium]